MASRYECSICLEPFTEPKILPCFHTFCKKCLADLIHADENIKKCDTFTCPNCRKEIDVPKEGADGFSSNFYLSEDSTVDKYYCNVHNEEIKFYCHECRVAICAHCCVVPSHKQHVTVDLKDVNHDVRSRLEMLQNKLRYEVDQLKSHSDFLSRKLTNISNLAEVTCQRIDQQVERICAEVKELGRGYKDEIRKMLAEDKEKLDKKVKILKNLTEQLEMGVDCSRNVLSGESVKPIVDMIPNIELLTKDCREIDLGFPEVRHSHFITAAIDNQVLMKQLGELQSYYEGMFTVRFRVDEIAEENKKYESGIGVIGGLPWCIAVQHLSDTGKLGIYLHLKKGSDATIESSTVNQRMVLLHTSDSSKSIVKSMRSAVYQPDGSCWGWRYIQWNKLLDSNTGFIDDEGMFSVQTKVKIYEIRRRLL